jgi:hypothetical protein
MDVSSTQEFYLSEFMILDASNTVLYATPKEGSELAHLVKDPLDIEFTVSPDLVTTVTPEVVAVNNASPGQFGYAEFGFNIVNTIEVVFSTFIQNNAYQLTNAHLKVEGLADSTSSAPSVLWTYETDLLAKANIVALKTSAAYRITVTKDGYTTWQEIKGLKQSANVNIFLVQGSTVDVYTAGNSGYVAAYFKNGQETLLETYTSSGQSAASDIAVRGEDIYVTGNRYIFNVGNDAACYWKNSVRVDLPFYGYTTDVLFSGSDVYISGVSMGSTDHNGLAVGFYLKNDVKTDLVPLTPGAGVNVSGMAVDGDDVYICGYETVGNTKNYLFWKNNHATVLPSDFFPNAVVIKNGHVYLSGHLTNGTGGIIKDGQLTMLSTSRDINKYPVFPIDIYVSDNDDVYACGLFGNYWKNGQEVIVSGLKINLYAISLLDNKIYVAGDGYKQTDTGGYEDRTAYWIDGEPTWGPRGRFIYGLCLVKH